MIKPTPLRSLDALFRPDSVAIIGASSDPKKIGGRPINHLNRAGFKGAIYPINPQPEVQGLKAYASLDVVPGPVDLAVIAVPAAGAPAALEECIRKGVRAVIVFSSGFGEIDAAGRAVQEAMVARCRAAGIPMLGPNSIGLFNSVHGLYTTFMTSLDKGIPPPGNIGMVSQSGALGAYMQALATDRGLSFSHFVATGNEADVDVSECIGWMAEDPAIKVILAYMEGCRDGARLRAALARAAANRKPVVIMKVGKSERGAAAAASHTGALAGADAVFDAVFRECGVHRASSVEEMLDIAYACSHGVLPRSDRLAVITVSGGVGVMAADLASEIGLDLPPLPADGQAAVRQIVPFASGVNPIDTTAQTLGDRTLLVRMLSVMLEKGEFDSVFSFMSNQGHSVSDMAVLKPALIDMRARFPDRLFVLCMRAAPEVRAELEANGLLIIEDPTRAIRTIAALAGFSKGFERASQTAVTTMAKVELPAKPDEAQSKAILARAGIAFAPEHTAKNRDEVVKLADQTGYPLAMKVLSPDIQHKSDVGGVALGIENAAAAGEAWDAMMATIKTKVPAARIEGVLLSPMISGGVETVLGAHRDPVFGPVVMFGLGGVFIEVLRDVVFRPAPVNLDQAHAMIREIRGFPLLAGVRGKAGVDLDRIASSLVVLSQFAAAQADTVSSVEINPFIALPKGVQGGGCGVDALIVRD
jgi:acyl-CoA synthetase (NDP forming)